MRNFLPCLLLCVTQGVRPPFTFPEYVRFDFAVRYNNETIGGEELIVAPTA